jgi:hypothetical protein
MHDHLPLPPPRPRTLSLRSLREHRLGVDQVRRTVWTGTSSPDFVHANEPTGRDGRAKSTAKYQRATVLEADAGSVRLEVLRHAHDTLLALYKDIDGSGRSMCPLSQVMGIGRCHLMPANDNRRSASTFDLRSALLHDVGAGAGGIGLVGDGEHGEGVWVLADLSK